MPRISLVFILALALAACNKGPDAAKKDDIAASAPLLISPEDVHTIRNSALASGPAITGSIQPERRADLRAEVPAIVLQVLKENGDAVKRGDLLVRLDATSIRDSLASAEAANRAAVQAYEQAGRQLERMKTLRTSGMTSAQAMEDAEIRRNSTQSEMEAAKSRVVTAAQQMQRTEVRAPFDGVVSDRKVSAGDTAQIGKELVKVIDPTSMRFEALVSADQVGEINAGQPVQNAILLLDCARKEEAQGVPREEALMHAGRVRLRPILMTTFALIAGMMPVAIGLGEGGEFYRPMAVAIIGGTITSTLLTLLVVPTFYDSIEIARDRAIAKYRRRAESWNPLFAFVATFVEALLTLVLIRFLYRLAKFSLSLGRGSGRGSKARGRG